MKPHESSWLMAAFRGRSCPASSFSWECSRCTLINGPNCRVCAVCTAPKPGTSSGGEHHSSRHTEAVQWRQFGPYGLSDQPVERELRAQVAESRARGSRSRPRRAATPGPRRRTQLHGYGSAAQGRGGNVDPVMSSVETRLADAFTSVSGFVNHFFDDEEDDPPLLPGRWRDSGTTPARMTSTVNASRDTSTSTSRPVVNSSLVSERVSRERVETFLSSDLDSDADSSENEMQEQSSRNIPVSRNTQQNQESAVHQEQNESDDDHFRDDSDDEQLLHLFAAANDGVTSGRLSEAADEEMLMNMLSPDEVLMNIQVLGGEEAILEEALRRSMEEEAPKPRTPPIDEAIIQSLPLRKLSYAQIRGLPENSKCCAICLDDFKVRDFQRTLPCKHHFHRDCIDECLRRSSACPICRQCICASAATVPV